MEDLIRQAFLHVEVLGPHVAEGHYDLVGPQGDIILPQVWETVVEPDWTVTMHMWPLPDLEPRQEGKPGDVGTDSELLEGDRGENIETDVHSAQKTGKSWIPWRLRSVYLESI